MVAVVVVVVRGGGDRSSVGSARSVARARMLVLVLSRDLQCCGVSCRAVPCRPHSFESVSQHIVTQRTMRIVVKWGMCLWVKTRFGRLGKGGDNCGVVR